MNPIKVITKFDIPLVGPRGGAIPHSLNKMKPSPYAKAPPWAIYKRCKEHYLKHVPLNDMERPPQGIHRHVQFIRMIPKGGRIMDKDNLIGGLKPLRDCLVFNGWLYDDDPVNLKTYYSQQKDSSLSDPIIKVVIGANLEEEYKYRTKKEDASW